MAQKPIVRFQNARIRFARFARITPLSCLQNARDGWDLSMQSLMQVFSKSCEGVLTIITNPRRLPAWSERWSMSLRTHRPCIKGQNPCKTVENLKQLRQLGVEKQPIPTNHRERGKFAGSSETSPFFPVSLQGAPREKGDFLQPQTWAFLGWWEKL